MNNTLRRSITLLFVLTLLFLIAIPVSANAPATPPRYAFYLVDLPEEAAYVDLLVQLPEDDPCYTPMVSENLPDTFSEQAEILSYCLDGYRSYTFHYIGAVSDFALHADDTGTPRVTFSTESGDIPQWDSIRLAILDREGNILSVSTPFSPKPASPLYSTVYKFTYNAARDSFDRIGSTLSILSLLLTGLCIGFNILAEWAFSALFGFSKRGQRTVALTNLVSQILMRFLFRFLYSTLLPYYVLLTLLLEVLVYVGEFLVYRKRLPEISFRKCLAFTLIANTFTLVIGLCFNYYFF